MATSQAAERRPGQILEGHDLEAAFRSLRPTTGHYGCPIMNYEYVCTYVYIASHNPKLPAVTS